MTQKIETNPCQEELPALARQGIELFNAGEYFEAHELLELAWRAESRPVRDLYQGLLQIGVGYYHLLRRNYRGARKMFQRGRTSLESLPDVCQGVDLRQFRSDFSMIEERVIRLGPDHLDGFDRRLLKPIPFITTNGEVHD